LSTAAPEPAAAPPVTGFVENCDRSNLDFMGRFLPPGKGFALSRHADGSHTVQFGDSPPVPLPDHDLTCLRHWRNARHPQVRITGVGDAARLLDAPAAVVPETPPVNAAGLSW